MKTCLLTALFVAITVAKTNPLVEAGAAEEDDGHVQTFDAHPWGIVDFTSGLLIGSYIPMLKMSYGGDKCFVYAFNWGASAIDYFVYFDHPFDTESVTGWFKFWLSLFLTSYDSYKVVKYCKEEFKNAKAFSESPLFVEDWASEDVRVMASSEHGEEHGSEHGDEHGHGGHHAYPDVEAMIMQVCYIGIYAFKIWYYYKSEYYFWSFGFAIGKVALMLVQSVEIFGNVEVLPNTRINYIEALSF